MAIKVTVVEGAALDELKETLAKKLFQMSRSEAWEKGICVKCKEPWESKTHSELGKLEYKISALCEECFDAITRED